MTLAQERDVWSEYRSASGEHRNQLEDHLARRHFRLVYMVANHHRNPMLGADELESAASYGLLKAIRSFDPGLGYTFSTYAARVMRNEIWMLYRKVKKAKTVPLDAAAYDESETTWADIVGDPDAPEPDEQLILAEFMKVLSEITTLTERERTVLDMRLNLDMTQSEVADELGIWQNSVSRIERRAKLKVLDRMTRVGLVEHHELSERNEYPTELVELAKRNGVSYSTLRRRVNQKGMDPVKAATTPPARGFKEEALPISRDGLLNGMTGREIRDQYFPERKLGLINNYSSAVRKQLKQEGLL